MLAPIDGSQPSTQDTTGPHGDPIKHVPKRLMGMRKNTFRPIVALWHMVYWYTNGVPKFPTELCKKPFRPSRGKWYANGVPISTKIYL